MIRDIPADADIYAEASPHALIAFMRIDHPSLSEPIRAVSDVLPYSWDGHEWIAAPFEFTMVTDDDAAPTAQITVQNVDRRIGTALRSMRDRATISVWLLTSADFDLSVNPREPLGTVTPLYQFLRYDLTDVSLDPVQITGRVGLRDYAREAYPGILATSSRFPGLFW